MLYQQIGSFYTADYRKHCGGIANCPRCGLPDSRRHRLEECQYSEHLRAQFPGLMRTWGKLPKHVKYFGLFSEPDSLRIWQSCLDRIPWPFFPTSTCEATVLIYTGVGVFFLVGPTFVWHLMRLSSLGPQATLPFLPKLCFQVHAIRLIVQKLWLRARQFTPFFVRLLHLTARVLLMPDFFVEGAQGTFQQDVTLRWVRGHVDWRKCADGDKVDAWFNHWAYKVAGPPLYWRSRRCELYQQLIREFRSNRVLAHQVLSFHARVGSYYFSSAKNLVFLLWYHVGWSVLGLRKLVGLSTYIPVTFVMWVLRASCSSGLLRFRFFLPVFVARVTTRLGWNCFGPFCIQRPSCHLLPLRGPGVRWMRTRICYLLFPLFVSCFVPGRVAWMLWCAVDLNYRLGL